MLDPLTGALIAGLSLAGSALATAVVVAFRSGRLAERVHELEEQVKDVRARKQSLAARLDRHEESAVHHQPSPCGYLTELKERVALQEAEARRFKDLIDAAAEKISANMRATLAEQLSAFREEIRHTVARGLGQEV